MSITEERMFILKMLEEGKITSDEAARLMEAMDSSAGASNDASGSKQTKKAPNFQDELFRTREHVHQWKRELKNTYKQHYNPQEFERMVDEFSVKAEKLGKNVATTTFGIVDKMIDFVGSFVDTNSFNVFGSFETAEKAFEAVPAEDAELEIEGINGQVLIKKHTENKLLIRSRIRSPLNDADRLLDFSDADNRISLKVNNASNASISHEIFLPAIKFKSIKLVTTNGKIAVEDTMSESFEAITRNSHIDLMGVKSDSIKVQTKNARISLSYITGRTVEINTNNSVIDVKNIKVHSLKALTMNGRIGIENADRHESSNELEMILKTTNGSIKVNMNDMEPRGYKIKARTTHGGINLLIPDIAYSNIDQHTVGGRSAEAESKGLEGFKEKVMIEAETVNGFIEIVK